MILPSANKAFEWVEILGRHALICRPMLEHAPHLFTTRRWHLGHADADPYGQDAWRDVASAVEVDDRHLTRIRQVHGSGCLTARPGGQLDDNGDVLVTDDRTLAIAIRAADCVPLLLVDRRLGAVSAVHAGWRGLSVRAPAAAVREMVTRYGTRPADLIAASGPSIGACCYEVGDEVRAAFEQSTFSAAERDRWFVQTAASTPQNPSMAGVTPNARPGRSYFDGWAAVRDQLRTAGVPGERIFVAELCTASHAGVLCSYRRDGRAAGRMAAAIRIARPSPSPHSPDDRRGR
jgi:YfiH family protein